MVYVLYDATTRNILIVDPDLSALPPHTVNWGLADIQPTEAAKIGQTNATYTLARDNTVVVTPVANVPTELDLARTDLDGNAQAAMARLADIATNGPQYTGAQVRDAVVDIAKFLRRTVRYVVST